MSRPLIDPRIAASPDLQRAADEGFVLEIHGGHLVIHEVPYVSEQRKVQFGKLVMPITFAGDVAVAPNDHVAMWVGAHPAHQDGRLITEIAHGSDRRAVETELIVDHSFSAKPKPADRYADFYEKVAAYTNRIAGPAELLDPAVTARSFGVVEARDDASVFRYTENASALSGTAALTPRLSVDRVAIVGLGGTGAYVLEFLAKTPVREIHLYDADDFLQHNAFRAPGAVSLAQLRARPTKVAHLQAMYDPMRRGIIAHPENIGIENVGALREMHTVFVCVDAGPARKLIVEELKSSNAHCIIVGMGIHLKENGLVGQIATTTASPGRWGHVSQRVSFGSRDNLNDEYAHNIQIAELNALNAIMAVIKWKKLCGFYVDLGQEAHSAYIIEGNGLVNDDHSGTT